MFGIPKLSNHLGFNFKAVLKVFIPNFFLILFISKRLETLLYSSCHITVPTANSHKPYIYIPLSTISNISYSDQFVTPYHFMHAKLQRSGHPATVSCSRRFFFSVSKVKNNFSKPFLFIKTNKSII